MHAFISVASSITLALLVVVIVILYRYGTKNHGYWKDRGIVFVPPAPFFGNLFYSFIGQRNQGQIVTDVYFKYSNEKLVGMWNLDAPALMVRDPDLVHKIMVPDFNHFSHNEIEVDPELDPVLASNMFTQRGEKWKRTRVLMSPAFTNTKVRESYDKILDVSKRLVKHITGHPGEHQLKNLAELYTADIVASWGLGMDGDSFTAKTPVLPRLGKLIFDPNILRGIVLTITFLTPGFAKLFKIRMVPTEVSNFFVNNVRKILDYRQRTGARQSDYVQYFIDTRKKRMGGDEVTDLDIYSGMMAFFIEGFETSSMVLSFFMYRLAMNPEIQQRLREEIVEAVAENGGELTNDIIFGMQYMDQCFLETNRLHTGLANMSKVCTERYVLDDGVVIEPGVTMILPVLGLQTDPKYWDDPETYNPEHFSEENKLNRRKGTYMPFGEGPRYCVGTRMANAMVKTAIASILLDYDIRPSPRTPLKYIQSPNHFMSAQKGGLYAQFIKRSSK